MLTKNQIALQTFLANGIVPKGSISFATSIANANNASSKQLFWVDKMVKDLLTPKEKEKPPFDVGNIFKLFDSAKNHKLKYPKISLRFANGNPIRLAFSQKRNAVFVSSNGFNSLSYARINRTGETAFYRDSNSVKTELVEILKNFSENPEKVAAEYGKLTHNCCFCNKKLDTEESLAVGYGPVCASGYGLMWGKKAPKVKPNLKELSENIMSIHSAILADSKEMYSMIPDEDLEMYDAYQFATNGINL